MTQSFLAFILVGCAKQQSVVPQPTNVPVDPAAFDKGEDEILRDLSAIDKRFALRARIQPSEYDLRRVAVTAILHEDTTLAVNDGAIDAFSFDARARGLEAVKAKLKKLPDVAPERELLARVVDGEVARLEEERALPRSASALVRAIVDTWSAPKDEREAADDDRWLARRLRELRESMSAELDVVRARDLDDALDELEHVSAGMVRATQELVKTREALEGMASRPNGQVRSDWTLVAHRLKAQVGVADTDPEALSRLFDELEKDLRKQADEAVTAANVDRRTLSDRIEKQLFVRGPCVDAVAGSRVRSLSAPLEREPACHLRKTVASANDPAEKALALATMHDHLVVAQWALDVAAGRGAIKEAEGRHRMLVPLVQPQVFARLERIALARPAQAIGAGLAVKLLAKGNAKAEAERGDVPLDIAERELK